MAFAVLRCEKVKANGVSRVHNHNLRTYENHSSTHINFDRNQNTIVLGSAQTHSKLKENLSKLTSKKAIRKDANVLLEFIFSASPEYFYDNLDKVKFDKLTMEKNKSELDKIFYEQLNKEKLANFEKALVDFIKSKPEFNDNVVNLVLHLDEKTPHYQLLITPILDGRLTAKQFFTPENARAWQNDFHAVLQSHQINLERGKEFSPAIHQTTAEYRSNESVDIPQPPEVYVPGRVLPNELGTSVPFTEKVLTTKTELDEASKQIQKRENAQKIKYDFYKGFYETHKDESIKVKQAISENKKYKPKLQKLQKEMADMSYKIKKFTDGQMENFRQIPLVQVALNLGLKLTEQKPGFARFKNDTINLVINEKENSFSENKENKNGFGAINFLTDIANYTVLQSIDFLANTFSIKEISRELKEHKTGSDIIESVVKQTITELPKAQENNIKNIVNYLTETRSIEPKLVQELLDSKRLYADKMNNCVFINENKDFAYVRGTYKEKRFVANKGQMNFLKYENTPNPEKIYLFESVIDLMSYRTLNPEIKATFVSIQGSAMVNKIDKLKLHNYKNVVCCFDNDEQGSNFDLKVKEICPTASIEKSIGKDFNEDCITQKNNPQKKIFVEQVKQTLIKSQQLGKNRNTGLGL